MILILKKGAVGHSSSAITKIKMPTEKSEAKVENAEVKETAAKATTKKATTKKEA